jgi:zinc transporter ZupT
VPEALILGISLRLGGPDAALIAAIALALALLTDLNPSRMAMLQFFGAGALIAMAAETMIPEAFHDTQQSCQVSLFLVACECRHLDWAAEAETTDRHASHPSVG